MKQTFIEWEPKRKSVQAKVEQVLEIVEDYSAQGYRLTVRQLYYQFVSRGLISNEQSEYRKLVHVLSKMRLAGMLDWDAIEDRNREPDIPNDWPSIQSLVNSALHSYRLPRWEGQDRYCELWVEKAALAGVLEPLAREFHVTLMVNRGYSSQSAMYESAQRILSGSGYGELPATVFYLGDHDPSGQDMVRDIQERLDMFCSNNVDLDVKCIALTTAQVEEYEPPPNPTKMTDSRAESYIERHGHSCWEVDALNPETLQSVIREELEAVVDQNLMDDIIEREERDKARLVKAAARL